MKNKKMLYLLVPGFLLVWGLVIWKIVAASGSDEVVSADMVVDTSSKNNAVPDTFSLMLNYRDPFLGKVAAVRSSTTTTLKTNIEKTVKPPTAPAVWPDIKYGGVIRNQKSKKQLAMLVIDGQELLLAEGQQSGSIQLQKICGDSVKVRMQKEVRVVRKM